MSMKVELAKGLKLDLASPQVRADGFRCWIGGESGSGKSSAAVSIVEQVIQQGGQVVILDAHGEYGNLWTVDPGRVTRIGYGSEPVTAASVDWCLDVVANDRSLLLDLSHWSDLYPKELDAFVLSFLRGLYELRRREPKFTLLLVEEAHVFAPQMQMSGQMENIKIFVSIVTGGRKYGLQSMFTTQRQSLVDVSVLASCNTRLFLRSSELKDWKRVKEYIPARLKLTYDSRKRGLRYFPSGQAVVLTRWTEDAVVQLRKPQTELRQYA